MNTPEQQLQTWVEINEKCLVSNVNFIRSCTTSSTLIAPCVKSNAYGHGLVPISKILVSADVDWLCVNALFEAEQLRDADISCPILIMGGIPRGHLKRAIELNCRFIVFSREILEEAVEATQKLDKNAYFHLKIETGLNRLGVEIDEAVRLVRYASQFSRLKGEGAYMHFANLEDNADHSYARKQLDYFQETLRVLEKNGFKPSITHAASSAALMLLHSSHFTMIRPGISVYGLWPSDFTRASVLHQYGLLDDPLSPVLRWKTRIVQVKKIARGAYVGYGCTYRTDRATTIAVVPVGYFEGYDRMLSNKGHVLIRGEKAPILGRVCMNMTIVDVTNISNVSVHDEVVLIGNSGNYQIHADLLATLTQTINYHVVTRIPDGPLANIPRIIL